MCSWETSLPIEDKISVLSSILPNCGGQEREPQYGELFQSVPVCHVPGYARDGDRDRGSQTETDENGNVIAGSSDSSDSEETHATQASGARTYQESDGTFAEDADGNRYYTDKKGNVTYNVDSYNYVDSNGDIITDGYGYIDPYTGAYIQ
ncbi:MAG: hypothetical protein ACLR6B_20745 [Blautia sp.]